MDAAPRLRARIDAGRLRYYRTGLRRWFAKAGRDLPWRRTRDPYRILVSEIMLHQTQVPRVREVYDAFLERFPTLDAVAAAPLAEVKAITDPLGYKRRGGYLKQIAEEVVTYRAGRLPDSVDELMELPGVGRYTAGAIMTFAHESPAPILDTNVARVLTRWFQGALPAEGETERRHRLWALADAIVPQGPGAKQSGWAVNQALMDFGAQVCVARSPRCAECPLRRRCHFVQADGGVAEADIVAWELRERRGRRGGATYRTGRAG